MSGNHLLKSCRHDDEMMMMMMMMAMTIWNLLVCSTAKRNKTPHFICMFGCGGGVKLIPWPNFSSTSSLAGDLNLSTYSATRVHVEDRKCQTFRYYPQHIAHWLVSSNILKWQVSSCCKTHDDNKFVRRSYYIKSHADTFRKITFRSVF